MASCGIVKKESESASNAETVIDAEGPNQMIAQMRIKPVIGAGDKPELHFTVYNRSASKQSFCKWHTPFEPPMSKYLDIKDSIGNEVQYRGIMAKRIMPPPADSYIEVKANDSISVKVDLTRAYLLDKPGVYVVSYNAQGISGLHVKKSVRFTYKK